MKYQVGDEVIILQTKEEGKVIEIINNKMLMVEVRGVRFPAYTDQVDFPYYHRFTNKQTTQKKGTARKTYIDIIPQEKKTSSQQQNEEGVWLSMIPKFSMDEFGDDIVELFKLYLINKNHSGYKFIYYQDFFGKQEFELKGEVLAHRDFYLHDIPFSDFNDNPSFSFEFSLVTPDKKMAEYFETSVKLKPKQLFQRIEEIKEKNEPSVMFRLFEKYPEKKEEEKPELSPNLLQRNKIYKAEKIREHLMPARSVVDLHIEKLSNEWQHLSNFEIMTLQLKEFEKWYDLAIAHRLPGFIVVHGVGSGKLKDEIHEILKTKNEVKTFVNQYHPSFGYGATEIFFQYK
ncbi:MAG: Smr/MutS family protein [Bacteroidetes bacterium]|nr:Smr/MutS family protein [Bacteroidota bacterium]